MGTKWVKGRVIPRSRETDRQTDRQTDRNRDREINRDRQGDRGRQTEIEREESLLILRCYDTIRVAFAGSWLSLHYTLS